MGQGPEFDMPPATTQPADDSPRWERRCRRGRAVSERDKSGCVLGTKPASIQSELPQNFSKKIARRGLTSASDEYMVSNDLTLIFV
jgi:hypothetical protein